MLQVEQSIIWMTETHKLDERFTQNCNYQKELDKIASLENIVNYLLNIYSQ